MGILRGPIVDCGAGEQIDARTRVLTSDGRFTHPRETMLKEYLVHNLEKVEQTFQSAHRYQTETSEYCVWTRHDSPPSPQTHGHHRDFLARRIQ